jgi:hypothetical protein
MKQRAFLCLSFGLLLLSACSSSSKTATITPDSSVSDPALTAESTDASALISVPKDTTFVYASGTTPSDETVIQQAITDANQYFEEQGDSAGTVTVSLVFDKNKPITLGRPDQQSLVVTAGADWDTFGKSDKYKLFAHEYYHVLQFHLSQGQSTSNTMAVWLKESSAEYIARQLAEAHGYPMFNAFKQQARSDARATSLHLTDLEDSKSYANYQQLYGGLGFSAVDYLVQQSGEAALFKFWSNLSKSPDWRSAFQSTFGVSVDTFYKNYESSLK